MTRSVVIGTLLLIIVGIVGSGVFFAKQRSHHNSILDKLHMAETQVESQEYENAVKTLLPVIQEGKRFPESEKALVLLAQTYEKISPDQAPAIWEKLANEYPQGQFNSEARYRLAQSLLDKDLAKARSIYEDLSTNGQGSYKDLALVGLARAFDKENKSDEARAMFYRILEQSQDPQVLAEAKDRITEMNNRTLWTPELDEFSQIYVVQKGDKPLTIANQFLTTAYYVEEANGVKGQIHIGKRLKVPKEPYFVEVDKDQCRLSVYTQSGRFLKWYPVGVGEQSWKTPAGEYTILVKEINPKWFKPGSGRVIQPGDPDNALGTRWMGIGNSLGIHGTNAPETIGFKKSAGCIRMQNQDVEELYKIIRLGARVVIKEGTPQAS